MFRADGPESRVNTATADAQQYADVASDCGGQSRRGVGDAWCDAEHVLGTTVRG